MKLLFLSLPFNNCYKHFTKAIQFIHFAIPSVNVFNSQLCCAMLTKLVVFAHILEFTNTLNQEMQIFLTKIGSYTYRYFNYYSNFVPLPSKWWNLPQINIVFKEISAAFAVISFLFKGKSYLPLVGSILGSIVYFMQLNAMMVVYTFIAVTSNLVV